MSVDQVALGWEYGLRIRRRLSLIQANHYDMRYYASCFDLGCNACAARHENGADVLAATYMARLMTRLNMWVDSSPQMQDYCKAGGGKRVMTADRAFECFRLL